jgi:hypothetical protein
MKDIKVREGDYRNIIRQLKASGIFHWNIIINVRIIQMITITTKFDAKHLKRKSNAVALISERITII